MRFRAGKVSDNIRAQNGHRSSGRWGRIARSIHAVRGDRFGPVAGPGFDTWAEAVTAFFADLAADLDDAGLDSADVHEVLAAVDKHQAVLNEVPEPRRLHGDLWTVNVMMASHALKPTITGVFAMVFDQIVGWLRRQGHDVPPRPLPGWLRSSGDTVSS
ncbi:phosphotransferase [Actinoalloteichus sp. GBA129-24]|uniref:phosphotransferase n=1 Tax=Actinoalloteichus sp. GBA129-24 TaxID=1612551 RepID=UPI0009504AEA|nr:phosphotransferase [Actinoalloteichus sp. GBA129-24]APU21274.1 hypothetical protein UA75_16330 [Actinoalloteichus sp. GBA129-24]